MTGAMPDFTLMTSYLESGCSFYFPPPLVFSYQGTASNPVYSINNFAAFFPKFMGPATDLGSPVFTLDSASVSIAGATITLGSLIASPALPDETTVVSYDGATLVLSAVAGMSGAARTAAFNAPLVSLGAVAQFLAMATGSLAQSRWAQNWPYAIAVYVAHYLTINFQTEDLPGQSGQQAALAPTQRGVGVLTSKSADGVSLSFEPVADPKRYGTWALTSYGMQLITMSQAIGIGPMYVG